MLYIIRCRPLRCLTKGGRQLQKIKGILWNRRAYLFVVAQAQAAQGLSNIGRDVTVHHGLPAASQPRRIIVKHLARHCQDTIAVWQKHLHR